MEIRVLRYFLAVVREESITRAADVLHITQLKLRSWRKNWTLSYFTAAPAESS